MPASRNASATRNAHCLAWGVCAIPTRTSLVFGDISPCDHHSIESDGKTARRGILASEKVCETIRPASCNLVFRSKVLRECLEDHARVVVEASGDTRVYDVRNLRLIENRKEFLDPLFFLNLTCDRKDIVEVPASRERYQPVGKVVCTPRGKVSGEPVVVFLVEEYPDLFRSSWGISSSKDRMNAR